MRSQLRFIMHPDDEHLLLEAVLRDPLVVLIDGPRWKASSPQTARTLSGIGSYCIIWSPADLGGLDARFIPECDDWYCESEHSTIQFLWSSLSGASVTEGRVAISTDRASPSAASGVERRFKALRKLIKKTYSNSMVRWQNPKLPLAHAGPSRSANPSKPDTSLWVGPAAMIWMRADERRRIRLGPTSPVEGILAPPPTLPY